MAALHSSSNPAIDDRREVTETFGETGLVWDEQSGLER